MVEGPLGIVAGGGQFPLLCARAARNKGRSVMAIAHRGETDPQLVGEVDAVTWIHVGQLGKLIRVLKGSGVSEVLFAGTITKKRIFKDIRPDIRALNLWRRIDKRLDDGILRAIAAELEAEGIAVLPSTAFLQELLAPSGVLTRRAPSPDQWSDIRVGWKLAKQIGRLDIGQCLLVKDRAVLAVEAIEGTDQTILRGGRLGGPGAIVIKVCKPSQDTRFDLPSIGVGTIETMASVKATALAVESGRALFFDKDTAIAMADRAGIAIVGVQGELEQ
jgi:DUF1009 family protein